MKTVILISALFFVLSIQQGFAQNAQSQKLICQKTTPSNANGAKKKKSVLKKLTVVDSLLLEREFRVEEDEATKDLDLQLSKLSVSPKVVVQKTKGGYKFSYFKFINDLEIQQLKEKLLSSCKIDNVDIDVKTMSCQVGFKTEANETDRNEFFKAFGYNGIIYR